MDGDVYEDFDPKLKILREIESFRSDLATKTLTKIVRMDVLPIIDKPSRKLRAFVEAMWRVEEIDSYLSDKFDSLLASSLSREGDHDLVIDGALSTLPISFPATQERVGSAENSLAGAAYARDIRQALLMGARGCVAARVIGDGTPTLSDRIVSPTLSDQTKRSGLMSVTPRKIGHLLSLLSYSDPFPGGGEVNKIYRQITSSAHLAGMAAPSVVTSYCEREIAKPSIARDQFLRPFLSIWGVKYPKIVPNRIFPLSQLETDVVVNGQMISLGLLREASNY